MAEDVICSSTHHVSISERNLLTKKKKEQMALFVPVVKYSRSLKVAANELSFWSVVI